MIFYPNDTKLAGKKKTKPSHQTPKKTMGRNK